MKRALLAAVLLCFAVIAFAQQNGSRDRRTMNEIQLRAKVKAVVPLDDFSGKVWPVDIDARFALTVRIISVTPSVTDFNHRAEVTFAIHSPAIVFAGDFTNGKTYDFLLCREIEDGKVKYSRLGTRLANGPRLGGCR
jgi:hypothetical protein